MVQRPALIADVPRLNSRVDQAILAAARDIDGQLQRRFFPVYRTMKFDQPSGTNLFLDQYELADAPDQILSGTAEMTVDTDVFLRPRSGPPWRWLEVNYGGTVFWQSVSSPQNAITITGDYGYWLSYVPIATLAASATAAATTIDVSDSSTAGSGILLEIDQERLIVTDAAQLATGATLAADLDTQKSTITMTVSDGTLLHVGEMIYIDAERLLVEGVSGNIVTVRRAVTGSVIAAHLSGAVITAPRRLTVTRGACGTLAASHASASIVEWQKPPSLITELNIAMAINNVTQSLNAYAHTLGKGESMRQMPGRGVDDLLADAITRYGRKARHKAA